MYSYFIQGFPFLKTVSSYTSEKSKWWLLFENYKISIIKIRLQRKKIYKILRKKIETFCLLTIKFYRNT